MTGVEIVRLAQLVHTLAQLSSEASMDCLQMSRRGDRDAASERLGEAAGLLEAARALRAVVAELA